MSNLLTLVFLALSLIQFNTSTDTPHSNAVVSSFVSERKQSFPDRTKEAEVSHQADVVKQAAIDAKAASDAAKQAQAVQTPTPAKTTPTAPVLTSGSHTELMAAAGISPSDYGYVDYIVSKESGWRVNASNGDTWGLCQALPGSKMSIAGADWKTNPVTQLRWCNLYAGRYGGWLGSYNAWLLQHWW